MAAIMPHSDSRDKGFAADGILCIGTSLAVHSAYRLAKRALDKGTEVAILNVGETRIESEGLDSSTGLVTKIESPIGDTLAEVVKSYNTASACEKHG